MFIIGILFEKIEEQKFIRNNNKRIFKTKMIKLTDEIFSFNQFFSIRFLFPLIIILDYIQFFACKIKNANYTVTRRM